MKKILIGLAAVVLVVAFLKRGKPRPAVPLAVSATVDHFAKGLVLGEPLSVNAKKLPSAHWRRYVGFVGPAPRGGFTQAVLIPSAEHREKVLASDKARLEAVELTAASSSNFTSTLSDLSIAFRGAPKQGCIRQSAGDYRQVFYWVGQRDAGGVAVLSDMGAMNGQDSTRATGAWTLFAWWGPFKGGETLLAAFDAKPCDGSGAPAVPASVAATAAALESMTIAFRDSVRGYAVATEQAEVSERLNTNAPNACEETAPAASTTTHQMIPFSIQLPSDFEIPQRALWESEFTRGGAIRYEWSAPDGSSVTIESTDRGVKHRGGLGGVSSECDVEIAGEQVHLDVGNASESLPRLTAGASYERGSGKGNVTIVAIGVSQQRQRELLAAVRTLRINGNGR